MAEVYLIHQKEIHFDLKYDVEGNFEDKEIEISSSNSPSELYISKDKLYLGKAKKWYKFHLSDIKNITVLDSNKLQLDFDVYQIILHCKNYSHSRVLQDFLFLYINVLMKEHASEQKEDAS
ncbi:MAG: hypothetical protein JSV49_10470 [Thermoplasmata archaeon]|nr:MAG: hypothetical protein JSV49_10470 [Thermoplasmata archaeon]